jgi:hypothetical protein
MKKSLSSIVSSLLFVSLLALPAYALKLAGTEAEITRDVNSLPMMSSSSLDAKDNLITWIDSRAENGIPRIYAAFANDPNYKEHLIDVNAVDTWTVRTDGRKIIYNFYNNVTSEYSLRVADVYDINHPAIKDVNTNGAYINSIDIDKGKAVYFESESFDPAGIYVFNTSEPNECLLIRSFLKGDWMQSNIAIDCNTVVYCGSHYDDVNAVERYYIETANVADIYNPVITRSYLPMDADTGAQTYIYQLDPSGDWLVVYGSYLGDYGLYAILNYKDDQSQWEMSLLSSSSEIMSIRADKTFAVWCGYDRENQPQSEAPSPYKLSGAVLFANGKSHTSVLKTYDDSDWTLSSAVVNGNKVLWGANFYHYGQTEQHYSDFFTKTIQLECGDKGFSLADLTRDCKVDFRDFAIIAEQWLVCTMPEDESCTFGVIN